jgi:anti-anti-sigma regulatory factor
VSRLAKLALPALPGLEIAVTQPNTLVLKGSITMRDPAASLSGFTRAVHDGAVGDGVKELKVDLTELPFVNSSGIRLFVDWATWLKGSGGPPYVLCFLTDRRITWQRTSFKVLTTMFGDVMQVAEVGS